jgi:hypothetical protein
MSTYTGNNYSTSYTLDNIGIVFINNNSYTNFVDELPHKLSDDTSSIYYAKSQTLINSSAAVYKSKSSSNFIEPDDTLDIDYLTIKIDNFNIGSTNNGLTSLVNIICYSDNNELLTYAKSSTITLSDIKVLTVKVTLTKTTNDDSSITISDINKVYDNDEIEVYHIYTNLAYIYLGNKNITHANILYDTDKILKEDNQTNILANIEYSKLHPLTNYQLDVASSNSSSNKEVYLGNVSDRSLISITDTGLTVSGSKYVYYPLKDHLYSPTNNKVSQVSGYGSNNLYQNYMKFYNYFLLKDSEATYNTNINNPRVINHLIKLGYLPNTYSFDPKVTYGLNTDIRFSVKDGAYLASYIFTKSAKNVNIFILIITPSGSSKIGKVFILENPPDTFISTIDGDYFSPKFFINDDTIFFNRIVDDKNILSAFIPRELRGTSDSYVNEGLYYVYSNKGTIIWDMKIGYKIFYTDYSSNNYVDNNKSYFENNTNYTNDFYYEENYFTDETSHNMVTPDFFDLGLIAIDSDMDSNRYHSIIWDDNTYYGEEYGITSGTSYIFNNDKEYTDGDNYNTFSHPIENALHKFYYPLFYGNINDSNISNEDSMSINNKQALDLYKLMYELSLNNYDNLRIIYNDIKISKFDINDTVCSIIIKETDTLDSIFLLKHVPFNGYDDSNTQPNINTSIKMRLDLSGRYYKSAASPIDPITGRSSRYWLSNNHLYHYDAVTNKTVRFSIDGDSDKSDYELKFIKSNRGLTISIDTDSYEIKVISHD